MLQHWVGLLVLGVMFLPTAGSQSPVEPSYDLSFVLIPAEHETFRLGEIAYFNLEASVVLRNGVCRQDAMLALSLQLVDGPPASSGITIFLPQQLELILKANAGTSQTDVLSIRETALVTINVARNGAANSSHPISITGTLAGGTPPDCGTISVAGPAAVSKTLTSVVKTGAALTPEELAAPLRTLATPRFDWGETVTPENRRIIEYATHTAVAAFDFRFHQSANVTIYATASDAEYSAAELDYFGRSTGNAKGTWAAPGAIFLATDIPRWNDDPFYSQTRNRFGMVNHEYAHILQAHNGHLTWDNMFLAENSPSMGVNPRWLQEGGAEIARNLIEHDLGWMCYEGQRTDGHTIAQLQAGPRVDDISTRDGMDSHPDAMITAHLAVDFLVTRHDTWVSLSPGNYSSWENPSGFSAAYEAERAAGFPYLAQTVVQSCQTSFRAWTEAESSTNSTPDPPNSSPPTTGPSPTTAGPRDSSSDGHQSTDPQSPTTNRSGGRSVPSAPLLATVLLLSVAVGLRRRGTKPGQD